MKLNNVKFEFQNILKTCGIDDYVYDSNFLIAFVLNCKLSDLLLIENISKNQYIKIKKLIIKRSKRIPLQHIVKIVEFYNCKLFVNKNVLIPRHETEILVDEIVRNEFFINENNNNKNLIQDSLHEKGKPIRVLDLCCGSGCIGISIAKSISCNVTLSDVSKKALQVAKKNTKLNNLKINVVQSDLFKNIKCKYNIIVSNPPYIKTCDLVMLSEEVKQDPILSLDGKEDGYYFYKEIIESAPKFLEKNGRIYFEIGKDQEKHISKLLEKNFECIKIIKDYNGINRIIYGKLKGDIC